MQYAGTGINLPLYNRHKVHKLIGLDLSQGMLQQAESKVQQDGQGLHVSFQQGGLLQSLHAVKLISMSRHSPPCLKLVDQMQVSHTFSKICSKSVRLVYPMP